MLEVVKITAGVLLEELRESRLELVKLSMEPSVEELRETVIGVAVDEDMKTAEEVRTVELESVGLRPVKMSSRLVVDMLVEIDAGLVSEELENTAAGIVIKEL